MGERGSISSEEMVVRRLNRGQIDVIVEMNLEAFRDMTDHDRARKWVQCNLKAYPRMMYFGAFCSDALVGYILWVEKGGFRSRALLELEQIAVRPEYRGRGIGTKLIRDSLVQVENYLHGRQASLKLVEVTTGVDNTARRLYERVLGAREQGIIPDFYEGDERIMIARLSETRVDCPEKEDLLKLEYEQCQNGYNNRDAMVPREISYVALIIGVLSGALAFVVGLLHANPALLRTVVALVGAVGLLAIFAIHMDIQSNLSCKLALRKRSEEIEEQLSTETATGGSKPLRIWRETIPNRAKYWEENRLKRVLAKAMPERESNYFVWAVRIALLLWVVLVGVIAFYGPGIVPAA